MMCRLDNLQHKYITRIHKQDQKSKIFLVVNILYAFFNAHSLTVCHLISKQSALVYFDFVVMNPFKFQMYVWQLVLGDISVYEICDMFAAHCVPKH